MLIRKMEMKDTEQVYEISKLNFSEPWALSAIEKEVTNPVASYFVAEFKGEVIGYGGMWHVLDEGEIMNIAIHPSYQRQGIGQLILKELLLEAKRRKLIAMFLEVRVSNEAAKKLYAKQGFQNIDLRKAYYHHPTEDALIMSYHF